MSASSQIAVEQCERGQEQAASSKSAPLQVPASDQARSRNSNNSSKTSGRAGSSLNDSGTSPANHHSSSLGKQRYGKWPAAGSKPQGQSGMRRGGPGSSSSARGFTWPAYMDRQQLQEAMKRGHVFRANFRVNASNRTEAFCSLEGLPSDMTVRGDVNHNRALEGDEVAVMPFKISDWFTVYKERDRLQELGLLPEGDADPVGVAEKLSQLALAAADDSGLAVAQSPWQAAGSPAAALQKLAEILRARPDMRVTGKVVSILEPSPRRDAIVGVLLQPAVAVSTGRSSSTAAPTPAATAAAAALSSGAYEGFLMLVPLDPRLPKGLVPPQVVAKLPQELRSEAAAQGLTTRTFVAARITDWPASSPFPLVEVRQSLGPTGDIDAGTAALLAGEGVKDEDFGLEVYACLPRVPWSISAAEASSRADFTRWRIFSIDPITARDLDDALSIQPLGNNRWRLGVHIADVASFVKPGTALDDEAQIRGTSVYLVQRVIPMLPRLLCEQLCSLQPGDPRFAFSIVWEVDENGHIYKEWAGRSIINSCAKLAYPMVQQMIDGCFDPNSWQIQLFHNVTWDQVIFDCLALHNIASRLRAARFQSGALRLNNTRLCFALDTGGNPVSTSPYVQSEANHLVEEFMLLANMRVAGIISRAFPGHAMLRRHPPPNERKMAEFKAAADLLGVKVDTRTAAALQDSLARLREACKDDASKEVIMLLATKPMQLALYFCTGETPEPATWGHYALAVERYTHFTSPIRRYPDVIVHRLLQAALELARELQHPDHSDLLTAAVVTDAQLPGATDEATAPAATVDTAAAAILDNQHEADDDVQPRAAVRDELLAKHHLPDVDTMAKIAKHSNETKLAARNVSDASLKLYLCIMLKQSPVVSWGVVTAVGGDKFFTVYLPEFGCETRIYLYLMGVPLTGSWDGPSQTLTITSGDAAQQQQTADGEAAQATSLTQTSAAAGGLGADSSRVMSSRTQPGAAGPRSSTDDEGLPPEMLLNSMKFKLKDWLESVAGRVSNPSHIPYAELPLQVQVFSRVPVIVSTYINRVTCHPEDVSAKLWLNCGVAGLEVAQAPAAATAEVVQSAMAYETLVED